MKTKQNKTTPPKNTCGCCQTFLGRSFFQGLHSASAPVGCLSSLPSRFDFPGKCKDLGNPCMFCKLCSFGETLGSLNSQPGQLGDHITLQSYIINKHSKSHSLPCWSTAKPWVGYSRINLPRFAIILG